MAVSQAVRALKQLNEADQVRKGRDQYEVLWNKSKPLLPETPGRDDTAGQCAWASSVLNLDRAHPITKAILQGLNGGAGHLVLARYEAPALRFEPASNLSSPQKFSDELVWQLQSFDGDPYPWAAPQLVKIARQVKLLAGASKNISARDEIEVILNTYLDSAERVEGTPGGTTRERYEAAVLLRPPSDQFGRPSGAPRYLADLGNPGCLVVRVSDLARVARQVLASSVPRGWLEGRMEDLGWQRRRLDGRGLGDNGHEPHARVDVFHGRLDETPSGDEHKVKAVERHL